MTAQIPRKTYRGWLITGLLLVMVALWLLVAGPALLGALIAVAGAYSLFGWYQRRNHRIDPGQLNLSLAPDPGALQGDVAGVVSAGTGLPEDSLFWFELRCVKVRERYRRQVIEHRKEVVWQARHRAYVDESGEVPGLRFQFSPPPGLAPTEPKPGLEEANWNSYHYWELALTGMVAGMPLAPQVYRVRVLPGESRAPEPLPVDYQPVDSHPTGEEKGELPDALVERFGLGADQDQIWLQARPGPSIGSGAVPLALAMLLFWAGWFLSGLLALLVGVFLLGRRVRVMIAGGQAGTITAVFGRDLFARHGVLNEADQLQVAPILFPPVVRGGEPLYRMTLLSDGKKLTLANGLRGTAGGGCIARFRGKAAVAAVRFHFSPT